MDKDVCCETRRCTTGERYPSVSALVRQYQFQSHKALPSTTEFYWVCYASTSQFAGIEAHCFNHHSPSCYQVQTQYGRFHYYRLSCGGRHSSQSSRLGACQGVRFCPAAEGDTSFVPLCRVLNSLYPRRYHLPRSLSRKLFRGRWIAH